MALNRLPNMSLQLAGAVITHTQIHIACIFRELARHSEVQKQFKATGQFRGLDTQDLGL